MKKFILRSCFLLFILYVGFCALLYFFQEKFLFYPQKIAAEQTFQYPNAQEVWIPVDPSVKIHGLWFKKSQNKGLIFYLHGNGGNMNRVGYLGKHYSQYGYDFFAIDYRSYGKSTGAIQNENQFYNDAQKALDYIKKQYSNKEIVIIGYSIGTATAAKLAAENKINQLVLFAPYYSLENMKNERYLTFIPSFLLRYPFETYKNLEKVTAPIIIFHGKNDRVIHYSNSEKLKKHLPKIDLYLLENQGHGGIFFNEKLESVLKETLK